MLASCGGDDGGGGQTAAQSTQAQPAGGKREESAGEARAGGRVLFVENCGSCHTLAAADTNGDVGPNLDRLKPDMTTVARQVRNGRGAMPAFQGRLSDGEIQAVARYVSNAAGG